MFGTEKGRVGDLLPVDGGDSVVSSLVDKTRENLFEKVEKSSENNDKTKESVQDSAKRKKKC